MLTPKCPPRDFRVSVRENSAQKRLYRCKWNLRGREEAGIREEFDSLAKDRKLFYINDLKWLCWETAANESPRSNSLIPGQIQGISLKTPPPLARNPLNSEFVWTNSLHIEQGIFGRKQRSLLHELRKFYCESADVA